MRWEMVPLGEVLELRYGKALRAEDRSGSGFPVIGSGGITGHHATPLVTGPTIVVGRKGSIGSLTYAPDGCWPIDTSYFVQLKHEVDLRWLFWSMQLLHLDSMNKSAAIPGLNRDDAYRARLPLPSLPEQRRIAAILDEADALRQQKDRERAAMNRFVDTAAAELIDTADDWRPLGSMLDEPFRNGISPSRAGAVQAEVLTLSAITRGGFEPRHRKVDLFAAGHSPDKIVTEGLHLICRGNGNKDLVGVMAVADASLTDVAFPDTMIAMRPSKVITSPTLLAAWRGEGVREQIRRGARTTNGTFKVNQQLLGSVVVPVPSGEVQANIDAIERQRAAVNSAMRKSAESLDALFASLQHRAFRGEL